MEIKTTHGTICKKINVQETKTPVATKDGGSTKESTITLNFYVGSICSEEILNLPAARELLQSLQNILHK
jgi:hypothetical protein